MSNDPGPRQRQHEELMAAQELAKEHGPYSRARSLGAPPVQVGVLGELHTNRFGVPHHDLRVFEQTGDGKLRDMGKQHLAPGSFTQLPNLPE